MGMNAQTGKALSGIAHIKQSIHDILSTRIGTRLMMPDYGSKLPELVDAPTNALTTSRIVAASAAALRRWEKRFRVTHVAVTSHAEGRVTIAVRGQYLAEGKEIVLEGITL